MVVGIDHVEAAAKVDRDARQDFPFVLKIGAVLRAEAVAAVLHVDRGRADGTG